MADTSRTADAVDLFEGESTLLDLAFRDWEDPDEDRYVHDTIGKFILEHLILREAARAAIVDTIGEAPTASLAVFVESDRTRMRDGLRRLSTFTEAVSAGEMNIGQDFDGELAKLRQFFRVDRENGVPSPTTDGLRGAVPSARYVRHHAPSRLAPEPKRWERFGPLVRFRTLYDHLRRIPTPARYRLPANLKEAERALLP